MPGILPAQASATRDCSTVRWGFTDDSIQGLSPVASQESVGVRTSHVGAESRRKLEPLDKEPVGQAVLALAWRADVAGRVRAAANLRHSGCTLH